MQHTRRCRPADAPPVCPTTASMLPPPPPRAQRSATTLVRPGNGGEQCTGVVGSWWSRAEDGGVVLCSRGREQQLDRCVLRHDHWHAKKRGGLLLLQKGTPALHVAHDTRDCHVCTTPTHTAAEPTDKCTSTAGPTRLQCSAGTRASTYVRTLASAPALHTAHGCMLACAACTTARAHGVRVHTLTNAPSSGCTPWRCPSSWCTPGAPTPATWRRAGAW